jgi:type II secretory pathway component PulC
LILKFLSSDQVQNSEVTLICYKIHLLQQNEEVFVYLFKNINPTSIWYEMKIREGDRLITLNEQDVTRISYENVYSIMNHEKTPFTCQVIWHPELYIEFSERNLII